MDDPKETDDGDIDVMMAGDDGLEPDAVDEAVYVEIILVEEDLGESRSFGGDDAKRARAADQQRMDAQLDQSLEETFPASDPVPISPGSD
ncbi:MAG: hypothetical protein ACHP7N_00640 [Caulobacterales bacterium]